MARRKYGKRAGALVAEEMRAMESGSTHVRTPAQAVAVGLSRARRAGVKVPRQNPAADDPMLQYFRGIADAMQTEPTDWQWIGPHMSQRMFGITQSRAEEYARLYGGEARHMKVNPTRRRGKNPPVVAFANPSPKSRRVVALLSGRVYELAYRHLDDGQDYKHKFGPHVCMQLLDDGSVRLYHEHGKPLFGDF